MVDWKKGWESTRRAFVRFWRTENPRVGAVRDIVVAGGVVLILLGIIWTYTGQRFPTQAPLVVVESGSMMHGPYRGGDAANPTGWDDPSFGRVGTIDPGDLVLVKDVDSADDIETAFGSGKRGGYGGHGDVIVYRSGGTAPTPIIHRALLYIEAVPQGCSPGDPDPARACQYRIPETCNEALFATFVQTRSSDPSSTSDWAAYCEGSPEPISLTLERDSLKLSLNQYPCPSTCALFYSGFITKGDNNNAMDQASTFSGPFSSPFNGLACCPVPVDWIVGKARGEIPWFGMIKLMLYGNEKYQCGAGEQCQDPTRGTQWSLLRATAPWDIWVSLFIAVGFLIALPMGIDWLVVRIRRMRKDQAPPETPPEEGGPPPPPLD